MEYYDIYVSQMCGDTCVYGVNRNEDADTFSSFEDVFSQFQDEVFAEYPDVKYFHRSNM